MKTRLSQGQRFIDSDGDEIEVVKINENSVILRLVDNALVVADLDEVLQDIASGDLAAPPYN